jgi:hypothetical protein
MHRPESRLELVQQATDITIGESIAALSQIDEYPASYEHLSYLRNVKKNSPDSVDVYTSTSDNRQVVLSGKRPVKEFGLYIHHLFRPLAGSIRTRQVFVLTLGDSLIDSCSRLELRKG